MSQLGQLKHKIQRQKIIARLLSRGVVPTDNLPQLEAVRSSGLFDDHWYRTAYPDITSDVDAALHYLLFGAGEGRNPGPLFDTSWYMQQHPDVAKSGMNPLEHYILYGSAEGRQTRSVGARHGEADSIPLSSAPNLRLPASIAVVIHAFYADVFNEMCELLPNIPGNYSLFISVPTEAVSEQVKHSLKTYGVRADAIVRVCPNRGRNFGPFLVEFAGEVAQHDVVLHLHTKKSLYTGSEQEMWRNHLLQGLAGSKWMVQAVLNLFASDSGVGVIYPITFSRMPYWAHHWLSNAHLAPALFQKVGIQSYQEHGYLDYPMGGMFWARVEAIRPLIQANWQYDDFPLEEGQADGTLAHAVERSIVQIAKSRGFDFIEVNYTDGTLRRGSSLKNLHQYAAQTAETLHAHIQRADLVSFDIFDTLVLRPSITPDSVLQYVGFLMGQRYTGAYDFFAIRKQAEQAARGHKKFKGDVDLDEIYDCFPLTDVWTHDVICAAKALELEMEENIVQPRPVGVDAVMTARAAGKRIIAISDTYYRRDFIAKLLDSIGVLNWIDEIYISSERQARKDRGDLWNMVMEQEHTPASRWLHIGDNEHSDIQRASDLGLSVFHLMNPSTILTLLDLNGRPTHGAPQWGTDLVMGPLAARVGSNPFVPNIFQHMTLGEASDVGYIVFGPLMFAFTAWLAQHPAMRELDHVHFLAREGFALQKYYELVRSACTALRLPESSYFLIPSSMVLSAVQGIAFMPESLLESSVYRGTLNGLLQNRLGMSLPPRFAADAMHIRLPEDEDQVLAALSILREPILAHGKTELDVVLAYCVEMGLAASSSSAVIDSGYSGSIIQFGLQLCIKRDLTGFYLAESQEVERLSRQNGRVFGCFSDKKANAASVAPIEKYSPTVKAFLSSPDGQLHRLAKSDDGPYPIFKHDYRSARDITIVSDMQGGAFAYCSDLLRAYGPSIVNVEVDMSVVQEPLRQLAEEHIIVSSDVRHALNLGGDFPELEDHQVQEAIVSSYPLSRETFLM